MKCAIVKSSTIAKHRRWDARFYLGDPSLSDEIAAAEKRVSQAQTKLDALRAEQRDEQERLRIMLSEGEVMRVVNRNVEPLSKYGDVLFGAEK